MSVAEQTRQPTQEYVIRLSSRVRVMARIYAVPTTLDDITRPPCSRCGAKTWLTRIEPSGELGHELLTFECPVCEITEIKGARTK